MNEDQDSSAIEPSPLSGRATRRVVTLRAGEYWKASRPLKAVREQNSRAVLLQQANDGEEPTIPVGQILLLCSIKRVDGEMHTIELAGHPGTHPGARFRMLVDNFTEAWEHVDAETAKARRASEVEEIHREVRAIEQEMRAAQSSPEAVGQMIEEGLRMLPPENKVRTLALPTNLVTTDRLTVADALALGPQDLEAQRAAFENQSREALAVAAWMGSKQEKIGRTIARLTPFYGEAGAAALAVSEDARELSARVQKGLANLDLYTGKDVEVVTISAGAPAAPGAPLVISQARLFCDEELSVWQDVGADFDFEKLPDFDATLIDERFLDQLFSSPRGVVLMSVRRHGLAYDHLDPWTGANRNVTNKESWLLVRNGANVHRVYSSVSSLAHAWMLFPTLDEMQDVFHGLDGTSITLESIAYPEHRAKFDSLALHYRRFLLLLCGLDHRLELFGNFYPRELANTSAFLSLDFQQRFFQFIADGDPSVQLPDGRPSLADWINGHNERLQSGSRVLVNWAIAANEETAPAMFERERAPSRSDSSPQRIFTPKRKIEVVIAFRDDGVLCATCETKGKYSYAHPTKPGGDRELAARVVLKSDKSYGHHAYCGWLCLDDVDPGDLRYYINSRVARVRHTQFIQLFKAAAAWLDREADEQKKTREALVKALSDGGITTDRDQALAVVHEAVTAWRAARRGESLPRLEEGQPEPEGWQSLLRQMWVIAERDRSAEQMEKAAALARERGREPLRLVSTGESGALVLYSTPAESECDSRLVPDRFVVKTRLRRNVSGSLAVDGERRAYMLKRPAREIILRQWPSAENWEFEVPPKLRREAKVGAIARCLAFESAFSETWNELDGAGWHQRFALLKAAYDLTPGPSVSFPTVLTPLGLEYVPANDPASPTFVGLGASSIDWLRVLAPRAEERRQLLDWVISCFQRTDLARERYAPIQGCPSFGLYTFYPDESVTPGPFILTGRTYAHNLFHPDANSWSEEARARYDRLKAAPSDVIWAETLRAWAEKGAEDQGRRSRKRSIWVTPGIEGGGAEYLRSIVSKTHVSRFLLPEVIPPAEELDHHVVPVSPPVRRSSTSPQP